MKKKNKKPVKPSKTAVNDVDTSRFTTHVSRSFIHIACLVFLVLIIYANTFSAPFQWDEKTFIIENLIVKDLHYFVNPWDAKGLELYNALINRYIGYLTFAINYRMHGLSVTGYHIVNIAIHIANSILVYFFVLFTFRTPLFLSKTDSLTPHPSLPLKGGGLGRGIAFFSAAIFAVHPLQTEAVTYIFQRFASLVTFFYLLSLVAYIKARLSTRSKKDSGQAGMTESPFTFHISHFTFFILSFVSAVLAMKTKENAFTLPFVIVLYEFCFFSRFTFHVSRPFPRLLTFLIPILLTLLIIPLTLMSLTGLHQLDPGSYGATVFSRGDYFLTQLRVIVTYLRLLFFPVNQNLDYDYPVSRTFFDPNVMLSFAFLAALFAFGIYLIFKSVQRRTQHAARSTLDAERLIGFGILWFFITLSVESSIVPLPMLINEYRVYLPSVGLIISAVTGVFWVCSRLTSHDSRPLVSRPLVPRFLIAALIFVICGLSFATLLRNGIWGDRIRLWEDTAKKSPAKPRVHFMLGLNYKTYNMFDKAAQQYLIAIKLNPDYAQAYNNLGNVYKALNMIDKAAEQYLIAVKLKPDYAEAHYNLGIIFAELNMNDKATEQYMIAVKLKPDYAWPSISLIKLKRNS